MAAKSTAALSLVDSNTEIVTGDLPPETYLISALIKSGSYNPEAYGITKDHFSAFKQVHLFLSKYQKEAGTAPPLSMVVSKYPKFPYTDNVSVMWAAKQLQEAYNERILIKSIAAQGSAIRDGNIAEALSVMKETLKSINANVTNTLKSANAFDKPQSVDLDLAKLVPVHKGSMSEYCRGIAPGQLWYVLGLPGTGKSFRLQEHAVIASMAGFEVDFFNLEMTERDVQQRIQSMIAWDSGYKLGTDNFYKYLKDKTKDYGKINIYSGTVCKVSDIASLTAEGHVVIVDYVGKLRSAEGTRSISDWRVAASISGELRDLALEKNVPVIAAAQLNRKAISANHLTGEHVSDTDAYVKDADVVIGTQRMCEQVVVNTIMKNRGGIGGRKFYTSFTPYSAMAREISYEEAKDLEFEFN